MHPQQTRHIEEQKRIQEVSNYLSVLLRNTERVDWLWGRNNLRRSYPLTGLYQELKSEVSPCADFQELQRTFRRFKQHHFLRIAGRDLLGLAGFEETVGQLSDLAAVALQVGVETLCELPSWWAGSGQLDLWPQVRSDFAFAVMGLGKLGGRELNYVSDVDLIFLQSPRAKSPTSVGRAQPLLRRFCQTLSRLLGEQVEGDWVFLVDLRLRPGGKDGELATSLEGAVDHYQNHGQAWERQALLKARPAAGDRSLGTSFLQEVRPFVFRRFLDYQALDELCSMRDRILAEAKTRQRERSYDVKLGIGGIRELEFVVQSFQLIYGGRYRELDEPNTLKCLEWLARLELMPQEAAQDLSDAYVFLRRTEHWAQLEHNRQTARLPGSEASMQRLASALGFADDTQGLRQVLQKHCEIVHEHFMALFKPSARQDEREREGGSNGAGQEEGGASGADEEQSEAERSVRELMGSFAPRAGYVARDALREIERRAGAAQAAGAASRIERFFHQARTRTGLKRLVDKEPDWLESVLPALVRSSLVSGLLAHQPSLVDFLPRKGGIWSDFSAWLDRAQSIVRGCAGYEEAVEWIRRLKNERMLLLALTDLQGGLHVRELMGELSLLADFVVQTTLDCIARHVAGSTDLPLAVLGLGKLGSRELGYYSDLDLMFVYEPDKAGEQERIPERIVRLIQRFMRMLSTPLQEGPGYEIDAELRPTGNYGPLVVTRQKWESYYAREADLWEVQALLRMRRVAGDERLGKHLEEYAASLCYSPRTPSGVWPRLCHLRARMEEERAQERQGAINMKLGPGGLADLEFLVQGHQLILGHENRILRGGAFSDMLLEVLRSCGLAEESVRALHSVYYTYRSLEQRLQHLSNVRSAHLTGEQLQAMTDRGLWPPEQRLLAVEGWTDLLQMRRRVREVWKRTCDAKEGS